MRKGRTPNVLMVKSMSVSQRITKMGAITYYMRGKEKRVWNFLETILSNQNMNEAYLRVYKKIKVQVESME
ncbi:hypothetical protein GCM10020331_096630 [Ectobacillus funiculus]